MKGFFQKNKIKIEKSKKWGKILLVTILILTAIAAIAGGSYMIIETQKTPDKSIIS